MLRSPSVNEFSTSLHFGFGVPQATSLGVQDVGEKGEGGAANVQSHSQFSHVTSKEALLNVSYLWLFHISELALSQHCLYRTKSPELHLFLLCFAALWNFAPKFAALGA